MRPLRFASRRSALVAVGAVCLAIVPTVLAVVARGGSSGCIRVISPVDGRSSGFSAQRAIGEVLGSSGRKIYVRTEGFRFFVGSGHPIRWRQARSFAPGRLLGVVRGRGGDVVYAGFRALYRSDNAGRSWARLSCGRVVDGAAVAAHQRNVIYLAADVQDGPSHGRGGLYRSRDGGREWARLSIFPPSDATVQAVAINPRNADDVTVALGDGGVARSVDGGRTWSFSKMWIKPAGPMDAGLNGPQVWSLVYGPGPAYTLWAGSQQGAFRRGPDGVWTKVLRSGYGATLTVVPDARLPRVVYAFGGSSPAAPRRTLDGGTRWRRLPLPAGIQGITVRQGDDTVYAWTAHTIYQSSNHGSTWTRLPRLPDR